MAVLKKTDVDCGGKNKTGMYLLEFFFIMLQISTASVTSTVGLGIAISCSASSVLAGFS